MLRPWRANNSSHRGMTWAKARGKWAAKTKRQGGASALGLGRPEDEEVAIRRTDARDARRRTVFRFIHRSRSSSAAAPSFSLSFLSPRSALPSPPFDLGT